MQPQKIPLFVVIKKGIVELDYFNPLYYTPPRKSSYLNKP